MLSQPGGAEVWKEVGGWLALTDAEVAGIQLQYTMVVVNSEKPPKPPKPPAGRIAERDRKRDLQGRFERGAEKFKAKYLDDPAARAELDRRLAGWGKGWRKGVAGSKVDSMRAERMAGWAEASPPVSRETVRALEARARGESPGDAPVE